jgi:hypothetical protein
VEAGLQEIERRAEELRKKGWLKVVVTLAAPDADVNRKVRAMVPNAVAVDVKLPVAAEGVEEVATLAEHAPKDVYRAYFRARHGREPDAALVELFEALEANAEAGA